MDSTDFMNSLAGSVEWAYNGQYCYFRPNSIPIYVPLDDELIGRFFKSSVLLGRLDGKISQIPEQERDLVLEAFMLKESTMSSAIEGTRSTMGDLYREESGFKDVNRLTDNAEIRNYKRALRKGLEINNKEENFRENDLFELHRVMMEKSRGEMSTVGSYRNQQVAIGSTLDTLDTAKFVPPTADLLPKLMKNLISYINTETPNALLKIALAHYQFETIHPFQDGNGRMGRLLIMLMLHKESILNHPVLYLSEYFNKTRKEYIERLYNVSCKDEFREWYLYFLNALDSQIVNSISLIDELENYREMMIKLSRQENDSRIIDVTYLLFRNPFIRVKDVTKQLGVSAPTASRTISRLVSRGILEEVTGNTRGRIFLAKEILDLLER